MYCAGRVGRAHSNQLKWPEDKEDIHQGLHWQTRPGTSNCCHCGLLMCKRETRLDVGAQQKSSLEIPESVTVLFASRPRMIPTSMPSIWELEKYHARGIHSWDGGQCSFHPSVVCSCGGCNDVDDLQCVGQAIRKQVCPLVWAAFPWIWDRVRAEGFECRECPPHCNG